MAIMHGLRANQPERTTQTAPQPGACPESVAGRTIRGGRGARDATGRRDAQTPAPDPRRTLGRLGEDIAADHLRKRGFEILDRNVRTASGEIDLIVTDGARLVFVEVKCRRMRGPSRGETIDASWALEAIGPAKQARLRRLAAEWLSRSVTGRPFTDEIRFDAIGIVVERSGRLGRLDHLEGAF